MNRAGIVAAIVQLDWLEQSCYTTRKSWIGNLESVGSTNPGNFADAVAAGL